MKSLTLSLALLTISSTSLIAHRSWILPSMTSFSSEGAWVTFDAAISNDLFFPNHHAMGLENMKAYAPDGTEVALENKTDGEIRSTFDLQLNQTGTYKVESKRQMVFAYWSEEGEKKRWRGSMQELETSKTLSKEGVSIMKASMSSQTYITNGKPNKLALAPEKKGLEVNFVSSHPNDLYTNEESVFNLVLDGKSIEGVGVEIYQGNDRFHDESEPLKAITDKDGKVTFIFPKSGRYWLTASHEVEAGEMKGKPLKKKASINLTFEVFAE